MMVYICSPYRADNREELQRNIKYAQELTRAELLEGNQPVTVHLYMTQCLDDNEPAERRIGIKAGLGILMRCREIVVGARFGISDGMEKEISAAQAHGIRIRYSKSRQEAGKDGC